MREGGRAAPASSRPPASPGCEWLSLALLRRSTRQLPGPPLGPSALSCSGYLTAFQGLRGTPLCGASNLLGLANSLFNIQQQLTRVLLGRGLGTCANRFAPPSCPRPWGHRFTGQTEAGGGQASPLPTSEVAAPGYARGQPEHRVPSVATHWLPNAETGLADCEAAWPRTRRSPFGGQTLTSWDLQSPCAFPSTSTPSRTDMG